MKEIAQDRHYEFRMYKKLESIKEVTTAEPYLIR